MSRKILPPPIPTRAELLAMLEAAQSYDLGIAVKTTDPPKLRELLIEARATSPAHASISIEIPSIVEHVFIYHSKPTDEAANA